MLNILIELNQGGSGRKKNGGEIKKDSINKEKNSKWRSVFGKVETKKKRNLKKM